MAEVEYRHRIWSGDEETKANISRLAAFLTGDSTRFGVMFCGVCGNGKSTLLHALQSAIAMLAGSSILERGTELAVMDAEELARIATDRQQFREIRNRPLLAIEDMGNDPAEVLDFGNVISPVTELLEHRYAAQLFTAITTNLTAEQVRGKYGIRVADRLNEMIEVIVFRNGSYRK